MRTLTKKCAMAIMLSLTSLASSAGEIAVIANPAAGVDSLTSDDVMRIFLAKTKSLPNEKSISALYQKEGSQIRTDFDQKVLGKSPTQVKAYWSQMIFTGRGTPPDELTSDAEIKKLVAANPGMIGYIGVEAVDSSVKVLLQVP